MVNFIKRTKIYGFFSLLNRGYGAYRWQILMLAVFGFAGGLFEGVGVNAVIPLFSFLTGKAGAGSDFISKSIASIFDFVNIKFSLRYLLVFIFLLFVARTVVLLFNNYIKSKIAVNYSEKMRNQLFGKMIKSDWEHLLKQKLGHLETILMTNVVYGEALLSVISTVVMIGASLTMYLVVAVNISFPITIVTICLGFIVFFVFKPLLDKTRKMSAVLEVLNRDISHFVNEHVIGMKTVKAMLAENAVMAKGREFFAALKKMRFKVFMLSVIPDSLLQPLGLMFVLVIFAFSYKTPGFNIAALAAVVYLIEKIFIYVQQLQRYFQATNEYLPYLRSVIQYEDEALFHSESDFGKDSTNFSQEIEFRGVAFSYPNGKEVFKGLNFKIKQGKMVGVVGPSGVGKTTLVDLLLRFFEPTSGEILVDGKNISKVSLESWRSAIGYISQDIFLLNDTIANNIRFYNKSISDRDIERVAKMADIYDFVMSLPEKFETSIGERGVMLSVGQRQRIVIARVLARNPKFLILDEATSALDNETEREIQAVIEKLKGKITVLAIAHRLSTVVNADNLIVLDGGRVVESGAPQDLLNNKQSYFSRLYELAK